MQDLLRFVKAHHTFARHNRIIRQRALELSCLVQALTDLAEKYSAVFLNAEAIAEKAKKKH
jgi:hypothetical protein